MQGQGGLDYAALSAMGAMNMNMPMPLQLGSLAGMGQVLLVDEAQGAVLVDVDSNGNMIPVSDFNGKRPCMGSQCHLILLNGKE
jgi:hypothetical protein